jgi:hypothetical protein
MTKLQAQIRIGRFISNVIFYEGMSEKASKMGGHDDLVRRYKREQSSAQRSVDTCKELIG